MALGESSFPNQSEGRLSLNCSKVCSATSLFAIHVEGLGDLLDPVHDVPVLASLDPGSQLLEELVRVPPSHLGRNEDN